jgi:hypothetical protein
MTPNDPPHTRRGTCIHEAGHAVVGFRCNRIVGERGIRLRLEPDGVTLGATHLAMARTSMSLVDAKLARQDPEWRRRALQEAKLDMLVALAGPWAEKIHLGIVDDVLPGGASDFRVVDRIRDVQAAADDCGDPVYRLRWLEAAYAAVERELRRADTWACIVDVADELGAHGDVDRARFLDIVRARGLQPRKDAAGLGDFAPHRPRPPRRACSEVPPPVGSASERAAFVVVDS